MYYYHTAISNSPLRTYFTYSSDRKLSKGMRVSVTFGKKTKQIAYIIQEITPQDCPQDIEIKAIDQILDESPIIDNNYFNLLIRIINYYLSPPGKVFDLIFKALGKTKVQFPQKRQSKQKTPDAGTALTKAGLKKKRLMINEELSTLTGSNISQQGLDIIQYLLFFPEATSLEMIKSLSLKSVSPIQTLLKNGILSVIDETDEKEKTKLANKVVLNFQQEQIVTDFFQAVENGKMKHLLYGITGSGKTEVYFEMIERILAQGKQTLFILPEIALTPQIVKRTQARFPTKTIAVYHSNLTNSMRKKTFLQAMQSEIDILLGTRSSVWLPLDRLGLIVVDEEHDESYMQGETNPIYDARKVCSLLSELKGIPLLFGSATPSIESFHDATTGVTQLHKLKFRPKGLQLPKISNINLSQTPTLKGLLTNEVIKAIEETIKNDGQCMILSGKKGFASYVTCSICGYTLKCPNCDVSLTYHKGTADLRCHYCGFSQPFTHRCPSCSNHSMVPRGFGSERVEEHLQKLFPDSRIIRIDRDNAPGTKELEKAWQQIERREVDIVVGTRMISKGLDFEAVQLVVILNADHMLYFPDFRSTERTFSLIHQMSGRAGRAREEARVIIQSYSPEEDPIRFAEKNDFESFFQSEIKKRKQGEYPPFKRIILFESKDAHAEKALERLNKLKILLEKQKKDISFQLLGPVEAFITKISGKYRYHMLLKMDDNNDIINRVKIFLKENDKYLLNMNVIIDPIRSII